MPLVALEPTYSSRAASRIGPAKLLVRLIRDPLHGNQGGMSSLRRSSKGFVSFGFIQNQYVAGPAFLGGGEDRPGACSARALKTRVVPLHSGIYGKLNSIARSLEMMYLIEGVPKSLRVCSSVAMK